MPSFCRRSLLLPAFFLSLLSVALTGCGIGPIAPASGSTLQTKIGTIKGQVYGGQTPIVGARVFLFAASTTGYGGNGIAASTSNASSSLMTSFTTGSYPTTQDTLSTSPTYLDYYETTDANGAFNLTSEYTCTPGTQVYLYTLGGQPTTGVTNANAANMAVLGQCPSSNSFATSISYIYINEVSTVAAAYAMAGFATDALHIGSSGTTLAQTGIANAFANANQLFEIQTNAGARTTTPGGNGTVPQTNIMSLANSLAACVNSSGASSAACITILGIKSSGSTGSVPTDTASAAINIAHNTGYNVSAIFSAAGTLPPFTPDLAAAPTDWAIGLKLTGGGLTSIKSIAMDGSGNAWIANGNNNTFTELANTGVALTGTTGLSVDGSVPEFLALDTSGNAWVALYGSGAVSRFSNAGVFLGSKSGFSSPFALASDGAGNMWTIDTAAAKLDRINSSGTTITASVSGGGLNGPYALAVDGSGNVWSASTAVAALAEFSSAGTALSGTNGYTGGGLATSVSPSIAIDSSGNIWVANIRTSVLSEFSNSGSAISGTTGYTGGGLSAPHGVAIDGGGSVWLTSGTTLSCFSSTGTAISGTNGFGRGSGGLNNAIGLAVDGSGNIWVASGNNTGSVTEYIGLAAPVITPIAAGLPTTPTSDGSSSLGTRP